MYMTMRSIRLRTLPQLLLAFVLTLGGAWDAAAQDVGAAPNVSKEGVVPGATAGATAATAVAPAAAGGDAAAIAAGAACYISVMSTRLSSFTPALLGALRVR